DTEGNGGYRDCPIELGQEKGSKTNFLAAYSQSRLPVLQVGLGSRPQVGFYLLVPLREQFIRVLIGHSGHNDAVLALLPVGGRSDLVVGGQLQGVNHPQNLLEVSSGARRVGQR